MQLLDQSQHGDESWFLTNLENTVIKTWRTSAGHFLPQMHDSVATETFGLVLSAQASIKQPAESSHVFVSRVNHSQEEEKSVRTRRPKINRWTFRKAATSVLRLPLLELQDCYVFYNNNNVGAKSERVYCLIGSQKEKTVSEENAQQPPRSRACCRPAPFGLFSTAFILSGGFSVFLKHRAKTKDS